MNMHNRMGHPNMAVVLPTIRPDAFSAWWNAWYPILRNKATIIVVWDMFRKDNKLNEFVHSAPENNYYHLFRDDGEKYGPVITDCYQSDSIRNLGFLKATELGCPIIATLDDDVLPIDNLWPDRMMQRIGRWVDPVTFYPCSFRTRGLPASDRYKRMVVLHHGLWEGIPDIYARDQWSQPFEVLDGKEHPVRTVPSGQLFPMCGMNISFDTAILPAMYFWPQKKYRRYGDIWCGLVAKRVADLCGFAVTSGDPVVYHNRLSDTAANMKAEATGTDLNNHLWYRVENARPIAAVPAEHYVGSLPIETTIALADELKDLLDDAGCDLKGWISLVRQASRTGEDCIRQQAIDSGVIGVEHLL